ncbi:hypothetical protein QYE76_027324 [Lolium multiflorum]|uniref:Transposase (putative) gypsy type domain-containing protein n=1 Tax=Lolium multiflorum TaxID=4521 RepID=A0AAD8VFX8_LOLMU|nr:hypothetical protein QYE76_027324 [Lolium multiflorum]
MATEDLQFSEWERSRISNQDVNLLKKLGFMKQEKTLIFPGEESYPTPRIGYRVTFVDHLICGLATPIHEFLRGLLFVYGLQLHHLTPNSVLHISIFITLCERFLGTPPNWGLWKRIFLVRRNSSHTTAYNVGGVVICVRPDVEYFDVKFPDSVQGWHKRWIYVHEEHNDSQEYNVAPFDGSEKIFCRQSWDAEATDEEKTTTEALMKRIHELQNTCGKELSGIQITAYFLRIRVQPLQARKNPFWMYAGDKDVDRFSKDLSVKDLEKLVRKISSLSKKDTIPSSCRVEPYSGTNASPRNIKLYLLFLPFLKVGKSRNEPSSPTRTRALLALRVKLRPLMKEFIRLGTQFIGYRDYADKLKGRMHQDFELEKPEDDRLLDALSLLEIHGDEVRQSISDAKSAFSRLFSYFFTKKEQPDTFAALTKHFIPEEDLELALQQEGLKIGVEGTIALVAESQQSVDWAKVGDVKKMETERWQSLIKAAKPNSKKILSFLGCKPTPSPSSTKPEVK